MDTIVMVLDLIILAYAGIGASLAIYWSIRYGSRNLFLAIIVTAIGWPWLLKMWLDGELPNT